MLVSVLPLLMWSVRFISTSAGDNVGWTFLNPAKPVCTRSNQRNLGKTIGFFSLDYILKIWMKLYDKIWEIYTDLLVLRERHYSLNY